MDPAQPVFVPASQRSVEPNAPGAASSSRGRHRPRRNDGDRAPDGDTEPTQRGRPRRGRGRGRGGAVAGDGANGLAHAAAANGATSATQQLEAAIQSMRLSTPGAHSGDVAQPDEAPAPRKKHPRGVRAGEKVQARRPPRQGSPHPSAGSTDASAADGGEPAGPSQPSRDSRRKRFGAQLTASDVTPDHSHAHAPHVHPAPPSSADLTTRLTHTLTHPPFADCPICFSPIHPAQPTWSCSLSPAHDVHTCCWTPFHLKCIREWAGKSVRETADAWAARGEDRRGEWRCPGCQTKRINVPGSYRCYCGRAVEPKLGRLATPHSCGEQCSRARTTCTHPCPLLCHPGPCPPCITTVHQPCHCGAQTLALRCSHLTSSAPPSLSCGRTCGKLLGCGKHQCEAECHAGDCGNCEVRESVRCYCGKEEREVGCGEGETKMCIDGEQRWEGRFECDAPCGRPFKCGIHHCQKRCHPPPTHPAPCPTDPSVIITCPCGSTLLDLLPGPPRTYCTSPIPTCNQTCSKPLPGCTHACPLPCHHGACPPCAEPLNLSCRCGETVRTVPCSVRQAEELTPVLCDRPCRALRHCGRHACGRLCCPLAWQGKVAKGKRKAMETALLGRPEDDPEGWHECDLVCGKLLNCRNHNCNMPDHRGPCPTCLLSSFDELVCHCGKTVLMPPVPCGTQIVCNYPCSRPPPPCGHPKTAHTCHEEGECPPCPFLTSKRCACGKTMVPNVRCSQEKVSCGIACGKLLECGFHSCDKPCHAGPCEACTQTCGKPLKLCSHPCPIQCHAPTICPETEPCPARVTVTCACGRMKQTALCGACTSQPASRESTQLKCVGECQLAKRNARLAEALGISDTVKGRLAAVEWPERLVAYFKENRDFGLVAEKNLSEFIRGPKKTTVLPHMVPARRRFVHEMASVYRLDVEYVDAEPNRSIQLVRRVDSRIPSPLLSEAAGQPTPRPSGRLVDMNKRGTPVAMSTRSWGPSTATQQPASLQPSAAAPAVSSNVRARTPDRPPAPAALPKPPTISAPPPSEVRDSWDEDD